MLWKISLTCGHAGRRAAGHDRWAVARAFLAAGNAGADEEQPLAFQIFRAAVGVLKKRIAAVNDDVARFEMRQELLDEFVHRLAGLDHDHHAARAFEQRDQFRERMRADDLGALGFAAEELIHLGHGAVEDGHGEAVVVHVENEILAHDGQSDQCDVSLSFHRNIPIKLSIRFKVQSSSFKVNSAERKTK